MTFTISCPLKLPRWNEVLVKILRNRNKVCYCERLNRSIQGSRTYLREIIRILANNNLIEIRPTKKIKKLFLTDKGKRVAIHISNLRTELKER